jgi:putative addiction module component (TIGR02574 family)
MSPPEVASLLRLPKRQRLAIAESLWLSVTDEQKLPIPATLKRILDQRLADYQSGKSRPISHAELMRRLRRP